jgi:hypothetical protein
MQTPERCCDDCFWAERHKHHTAVLADEVFLCTYGVWAKHPVPYDWVCENYIYRYGKLGYCLTWKHNRYGIEERHLSSLPLALQNTIKETVHIMPNKIEEGR